MRNFSFYNWIFFPFFDTGLHLLSEAHIQNDVFVKIPKLVPQCLSLGLLARYPPLPIPIPLTHPLKTPSIILKNMIYKDHVSL